MSLTIKVLPRYQCCQFCSSQNLKLMIIITELVVSLNMIQQKKKSGNKNDNDYNILLNNLGTFL